MSCSASLHLVSPTCNSGVCSGTCVAGWGDCDGNPSNGCETQLLSPQNCGACRMFCTTLPHATGPYCNSMATCDYTTCATGWADCDGNRMNGCECGTLQNTAGPACGGALCDYTTCNAGYADCDGNRQDGCECHPLNVTNAICTMNDSGSPCDYAACQTGFTDCDGVHANGCESNTSSDSNNCGTCGNACPTGQGCTNGVCVPATGMVRNVAGQSIPIIMVPCGNGTTSNCTLTVAEASCTSIGKKLVSHATDGGTSLVSLGATVSCHFSISYFTNTSASLAGQCLIGISNASWSSLSCCQSTMWHGNIVQIPTTLGQQFGFVYAGDSGYTPGLANVTGSTWGCQNATVAPSVIGPGGCSVYNVACE
jgi:hypothetical protein